MRPRTSIFRNVATAVLAVVALGALLGSAAASATGVPGTPGSVQPPVPREVGPRDSFSVEISYDPDPAYVEESLTITATVIGGESPFTYDWVETPFGCPSGDQAAQITCTPVEEEDTETEVEVTDGSETTEIAEEFIYVEEPPGAYIYAYPRTGPAPLDVDFEGELNGSFGVEATYLWTFGDGSVSSQAWEPWHAFNESGNYLVQLTLTVTATGQSYSTKAEIVVTAYQAPPSVVSFTVSPSTVTVGSPAYFKADVTGGAGYLDYAYVADLDCLNGDLEEGVDFNESAFGCTTLYTGSYVVFLEVRDEYDRNATAKVVLNVVGTGGASGSGGSGSGSTGFSTLDTGLSATVAGLAVLAIVLGVALSRARRSTPPRSSPGVDLRSSSPPQGWAPEPPPAAGPAAPSGASATAPEPPIRNF